MKTIINIILAFILFTISVNADLLRVGLDTEKYEYQSLQEAWIDVQAGDTIFISNGIYSGGLYIEQSKGTEELPILIVGENPDSVVFQGGGQAIHFVDISHFVLKGITFTGQSSNGVNIDDGGTYDTPAENIMIIDCHWKDMDATGNNDMLKMSGIDDFSIINCSFENGSAGGSLIDMVGCHRGYIQKNTFKNGGSNSIQAKGACSQLSINQNYFINGGLRSINIGGSTGAAYFRPLGADYEAMHILVAANQFFFSQAPINYVGAIECAVMQNTIYIPEKWVIRILQENVDGYQPCGRNIFANNLMYIDNVNPSYALNIGANTESETFLFANNLWYNFENLEWTGPNIPNFEIDPILNQDPEFVDIESLDLHLNPSSPAVGAGFYNPEQIYPVDYDYDGNPFSIPPSIGAFEFIMTDIEENAIESKINIYPNPAEDILNIRLMDEEQINEIEIYDLKGNLVLEKELYSISQYVILDISSITTSGSYFVFITTKQGIYHKLIQIVD